MSYHDIGEGIYQVLTTITEISQIYQYEPNELKKYPAVTITALGHADEFSDTAHNKRVFQFMVRVYFRRDTADYEDIMRRLVDSIIVAVESNPSLSDTCDFAQPTESNWLYQEKEVPVRICEITITANKRMPRIVGD